MEAQSPKGLRNPMAQPRQFDWETIEKVYRTGRHSLKQLSAEYGPAPSTIVKRAKKEGWEKDLTGAVQQRTREKLSRPDSTPPDMPEAEVVERAADENAQVIRGHREMLADWRRIAARFAQRLSEQLDQGTMQVQTRTGDIAEVDLPLDYVGKAMSAGTQAVDRVVTMERRSYGLDQDNGDTEQKTFEELMSEVAPEDG